MKYYFTILLFVMVCFVFAQVAPSPDAIGTVTLGQAEDLYRGYVTESVPIYSLKAENGYQVPVGLTYQTRGIKVKDIASSVGLGWNLNAGGAITRVMRDEPDDQSSFSQNPNGVQVRTSQYNEEKGYDFEKDVFFYSHPTGGGKFISTRDAAFIGGNSYTDFYGLPYVDDKIEFFYTNSSTSYWKVTDTRGIVYVYGQSATAREITRSRYYEEGTQPKENADFTYISTWYLEEIIFPDLPPEKSVRFTYSKGPRKFTVYDESLARDYQLVVFERRLIDNDPSNEIIIYTEPGSHKSEKRFVSEIEYYPSQVERIRTNNASLAFSYSSRIDNNSLQRISEVLVKDYSDKTVFTFDLNHEYFDSSDLGDPCNSNSSCKRLKLKSVSKNGRKVKEFYYMNDKSSAYSLPSVESHKVDKYGYFSSQVVSPFERYSFEQFPPGHPYNSTIWNVLKLGNKDNDRSPTVDAQANSLWQVVYPSGAVKEYEYDKRESGGIVVSSIKLLNGDKAISHVSYFYRNPITLQSDLHGISAAPNGRVGPTVTLFSDSPYLKFDYMNLGGFENVVVKNELSGTSSEYNFYVGNIHDSSEKSRWSLDGTNWTKIGDIWNRNAPLMSPDYSPEHGLPSSTKTFDREGHVISENRFFYRKGDEQGHVKEHAFMRLSESGAKYNVGQSIVELRPFQLDYTTIVSYEGDMSIHSKTRYSYHANHPTLPKSVETFRVDAEGNRLENLGWYDSKSVTYYPSDNIQLTGKYPGNVTLLREMVDKNILAIPIAVESWTKPPSSAYGLAKVVSTTYTKDFGLIHPYKSYASNFGSLNPRWTMSSLDEEQTYSYTPGGQTSSIVGRSGIATQYSYDNQGYLKSQTASASGMNRTTSYTYKPMVGILSATGPDGRKTSYEYDNQNRLHLIRNNESKIVERYRYNYANESNVLSAQVNIAGPNIAGREQTISLSDLKAYGETEIKWYDSDGDLLSTSTSFKHTFSGAGAKTIRLVLLNPEYDPLTINRSKFFYENEWSLGEISGGEEICSVGGISPIGGSGSSTPEYYSIAVNFGGTDCGTPSGDHSYQWQYHASGSWVNFGSNNSTVQLPDNLRVPGSVQIRVRVDSNCGLKQSGVKTITVKNCAGGGGTSGSWNLSMSPLNDEICKTGQPSSALYRANLNGSFTCSGLQYTYSWSIKHESQNNYTNLSHNGSQLTVTQGVLQTIRPSLVGQYTLRVQVADNCNQGGSVKTATATIRVPSDCGLGIGD
ncbi:MAG: hypothetical protein AAF789_08835 [Bacteroidota bacterium]